MRKGFKWIIAFAGAIVIVLLLRGFAFTSCLIPSSGMENSLFQGERILVNKWSYGLRVPYMSLFSYHRWNPRRIDKDDIVVSRGYQRTGHRPERNLYQPVYRCTGRYFAYRFTIQCSRPQHTTRTGPETTLHLSTDQGTAVRLTTFYSFHRLQRTDGAA